MIMMIWRCVSTYIYACMPSWLRPPTKRFLNGKACNLLKRISFNFLLWAKKIHCSKTWPSCVGKIVDFLGAWKRCTSSYESSTIPFVKKFWKIYSSPENCLSNNEVIINFSVQLMWCQFLVLISRLETNWGCSTAVTILFKVVTLNSW